MNRAIVIHDAKGLHSLFRLFLKVYVQCYFPGQDFNKLCEILFEGLSRNTKNLTKL